MTRAKGKSQRQNGISEGKAKPNTIPMAKVTGKRRRRAKYRQRTKGENEIVVSGRDLVVPTPRSLPTGGPGEFSVFQLVPANPTYWEGTRIQKLAQTYQLYRPLKFKVHYHPQVPVTNPGLVVYGTLYQDQATTESALQQVLNTSNGGGIKECYSPFTSVVDVGDRFLQMRTYNTVGSAADTANCPFVWCATYSGYSASAVSTSACPGWVEVEWTYRFVNGLPGPGNQSRGLFITNENTLTTYNRMLPRTAPRIDWSAPFGVPIGVLKAAAEPLLRHIACILLKETKVGPLILGIGKALNWMITQADARSSSTTIVTDDAGREIELPDDTPVVVLQSGMPQSTGGSCPGNRVIERMTVITSGTITSGSSTHDVTHRYDIDHPQPDGSHNSNLFSLLWESTDDDTQFLLRLESGNITGGSVTFTIRVNDFEVVHALNMSNISQNNTIRGPLVNFYNCMFEWN